MVQDKTKMAINLLLMIEVHIVFGLKWFFKVKFSVNQVDGGGGYDDTGADKKGCNDKWFNIIDK